MIPCREELLSAAHICERLAKHIEETEPHATTEIQWLRDAVDSLNAFNEEAE